MAISRPQRRLGRALAWHDLRPRLLAALIFAGLGVGAICFLLRREDYRTQDLQGAPVLQATARVESVIPLVVSGKHPVFEFQVFLRVGEKRGFVTVPMTLFPNLAKGREVHASYQIGKSGALYINRVEPL